MARRKLNLSDQDRAEMLRLYVGENVGIVTIAKRFTDEGKPVSSSTVVRILRAQGATLRKRGTRSHTEVTTNPLEDATPTFEVTP